MRKVALFICATVMLLLSGCGGRGGSSTSPPVPVNLWQPGVIKGTVNISWASRGRANEPSFIRTMVSLGRIKPDGTFSVVALPNSPTLAMIENSAGDVLAYVYIDKDTRNIDDKLCASTLAFMSTKGGNIPAEGRMQFWKELQAQPEITALAADLATLYASGQPDPSAMQLTLHNNLDPLLRRITGQTRGISVDPSNGKSGIEVLQQGLSDIYIKNHYRRRAHAFLQKVEVTLADGTVEARDESIADFPVDPITNPNSLNAAVGDVGTVLGDYFSGNNELFTSNVAWVPTTTAPRTLQVTPADAKSTKYRVVVVGPGMFSDPPSPLTPAMEEKFNDLLTQTVVIDFLIPSFFIAIGPVLEQYENAGSIDGPTKEIVEQITTVAKDMISLIIAQPAIQQKLREGDYAGGYWDAISALVQTDTFVNSVRSIVIGVLRPLLQSIINNPNFAPDIAIGDLEENADKFYGNLKRLFASLDLFLQGADFAMIIGHISSSQAYEEFFVTATKARVRLAPPNGRLSVRSSMTLTASVPDATGDEAPLLAYKWKIVSGNGVQLTNGINTGQEFTSSSPEVQLQSLHNQTGTVTVEVEAIINNIGSQQDQSLGKATSQINVVNDKVVLTPVMSSIKPGQNQVLQARINDPSPDGHYLFKWTLSDGSGSIDTGPELTARTQVTYGAGQNEGFGEVTVEAYMNGPSGVVRIGTATARVRVENEPTVVAASYSAFTASTGEGRGRVVALVKCPRVEGAKSYRLRGVGGYDYAYFGDSINFGISPFNNEPEIGLVEPPNEVWVGLSGWDGPESGIGGAVAWMDSRFSGFSFYVEVTR